MICQTPWQGRLVPKVCGATAGWGLRVSDLSELAPLPPALTTRTGRPKTHHSKVQCRIGGRWVLVDVDDDDDNDDGEDEYVVLGCCYSLRFSCLSLLLLLLMLNE